MNLKTFIQFWPLETKKIQLFHPEKHMSIENWNFLDIVYTYIFLLDTEEIEFLIPLI